jgi:hypothetical protein
MFAWSFGLEVFVACHVLQAQKIIVPVMLAHCLTNNVPIGERDDWDKAILPLGPDWCYHLYTYVAVYVKKIRHSLISIGEWDFVVTPWAVVDVDSVSNTLMEVGESEGGDDLHGHLSQWCRWQQYLQTAVAARGVAKLVLTRVMLSSSIV